MKTHEDERRILFDWANGDFKSAKAIVAKQDGVIVGHHFHQNKDEQFFLLMGTITEMKIGDTIFGNVKAPFDVLVKKGTYHKFVCAQGSVLLCAATEPYDDTDIH